MRINDSNNDDDDDEAPTHTNTCTRTHALTHTKTTAHEHGRTHMMHQHLTQARLFSFHRTQALVEFGTIAQDDVDSLFFTDDPKEVGPKLQCL